VGFAIDTNLDGASISAWSWVSSWENKRNRNQRPGYFIAFMLIGSLTADSVEQLSSLERKHTCSQIRIVFPSLGMGIGARCYHHHLANRDPFGS